MIFYSSQFQEASIGIIIITFVFYYFPMSLILQTRSIWHRSFPPKRRLLTNEEYYEQSVRETTKALAELKSFCSSPDAQPWRVMMKLKDPQRFASFMEGSPHLLDSEIMEYETSRVDQSDISEDEDEEENENIVVSQQQSAKRHIQNGFSNSTFFTSTPTTYRNVVPPPRQYTRDEMSDDED